MQKKTASVFPPDTERNGSACHTFRRRTFCNKPDRQTGKKGVEPGGESSRRRGTRTNASSPFLIAEKAVCGSEPPPEYPDPRRPSATLCRADRFFFFLRDARQESGQAHVSTCGEPRELRTHSVEDSNKYADADNTPIPPLFANGDSKIQRFFRQAPRLLP